MGRILIGNIKGPQGEAGKNFEYAKTYASVSAMNADFSGTDVAEGEYVVISAGIDDADNGRVYRKGTNSYVYVNRVNGPTGPRGATGPMPTLVTNLDTTTAGQGALDASVGPTIKGKVTKEGGETGDTVTTFNTSDTTTDAEIIEYTAMEKLTSGSPLKTLMSIMSKAVKNVRWFQKLLGTTDISGIGNGTVTNAVSTLNDAIGTVNTNLARSYISNIGGNAVLEKSGNVCVLHYTIAYFDPNGTLVPEALRPKFGNGVWNEVVVTNDYTNNYAMQVTNGGKVQLQKNGVAVSTQLNGVRGQVSWII